MIGLLFALVLLAPLAGLLWTAQEEGNPAALAVAALYGLHLLALAWGFGAVRRRRTTPSSAALPAAAPAMPLWALPLSAAIAAVVLGLFGGIAVLAGNVDKEQMRSMHGAAGPLLAILVKYVQPALFAYAAFVCRRRIDLGRQVPYASLLLLAAVTLLTGAALGGKASGLIALLPGLAAFYWNRLTWRRALLLMAAGGGFLLLAAWLFDRDLIEAEGTADLATYLVYRAFVLSSEAALHAGTKALEGEPQIAYLPTLLEWFGKSVVARWLDDPSQLYRFGLSSAITADMYPDEIDRINSGEWNVTPTSFVEWLVLGGPIAALLGGWVTGAVLAMLFNRIDRALHGGALRQAALLATYLTAVYLAWVNSGGMSNLVHPVAVLGLVAAALLLPAARRRRAPAGAQAAIPAAS